MPVYRLVAVPPGRFVCDLEHQIVHDADRVVPACRLDELVVSGSAGYCVPDGLNEALLNGLAGCDRCVVPDGARLAVAPWV